MTTAMGPRSAASPSRQPAAKRPTGYIGRHRLANPRPATADPGRTIAAGERAMESRGAGGRAAEPVVPSIGCSPGSASRSATVDGRGIAAAVGRWPHVLEPTETLVAAAEPPVLGPRPRAGAWSPGRADRELLSKLVAEAAVFASRRAEPVVATARRSSWAGGHVRSGRADAVEPPEPKGPARPPIETGSSVVVDLGLSVGEPGPMFGTEYGASPSVSGPALTAGPVTSHAADLPTSGPAPMAGSGTEYGTRSSISGAVPTSASGAEPLAAMSVEPDSRSLTVADQVPSAADSDLSAVAVESSGGAI